MSLLSSVKTAVVRRVVARSGGVDLTKLDRVPERLSWPLNRHGIDPTPRLTLLCETERDATSNTPTSTRNQSNHICLFQQRPPSKADPNRDSISFLWSKPSFVAT